VLAELGDWLGRRPSGWSSVIGRSGNVGESGLHIETESSRSTLPWKTFIKRKTADDLVLLFIAPHSHSHQSGSFLFGSGGFDAFKGLSGFSVPFYVFLLGLLVAQYTFTGYDASAHVTEETLNAAVSGPKGIVTSIWVSWIAGFVLLSVVGVRPPLHAV